MHEDTAQAQESRSERVSLAVTKRERAALRAVAEARRVPHLSFLLRDMSLAEVMVEFERLRQLVALSVTV